MDRIRSVIFNVVFYGIWTPLYCILLLPALLFPRSTAMWVAKFYQDVSYLMQKYIMGLDYELRGMENFPGNDQTYIIASKHYSAYETLHIYRLFHHPAVILKKELLSTPLFGWFLRRMEVIAIDRGRGATAVNSLFDGARKVQGQKRPIVIFPQGTRVPVGATIAEKPYKAGLVKLYGEFHFPIVPVAINSGLYWPRNSFWRKSGTVIIEFLPHIPPGLPTEDVMKMVENAIETASDKLIEEGRAALAARK